LNAVEQETFTFVNGSCSIAFIWHYNSDLVFAIWLIVPFT